MKTRALYLRTIVFGVIDSLVSTVGLLAGIDVAGAPHATIALTGVVYAFVEAFSMAVGNFLSEESAEEYAKKADVDDGPSFGAAIMMFISFVLASFIPIVPYFLFVGEAALLASVGISILALFVVGMWSARLARLPLVWRGVRMVLLGGAAIAIGVVIGTLVPVA
ncbi:MAG TPA: VIT1/CCC1 transporter family protein [Candidatus Paceibacterota bacterium]|nr:VIT1/CCC1 transporter family protein [Candidatus Paceibacterota bacterium]